MIELTIEVEGAPDGIAEALDQVSEFCCADEGVSGMISFGRLVDDREMQRINRLFRSVDKPTDVLSFPSIEYRPGQTARDCPKKLARERDPDSGRCSLGDFVISLPRAAAQAEEYGHSLMRELCYLAAHAQFHLIGYDHTTDEDKRAMREKEERVMVKMGLTRQKNEEAHPMTDRKLFERACAALQNAYVPYSGFRVGACLLADDGRAFDGCNVENASYGATICAERTAVVSAVSQGARQFTRIAVVGEHQPAWPCGVCRQVLNEFSQDMWVICGCADSNEYEAVPLKELLPKSFGPGDLGAF